MGQTIVLAGGCFVWLFEYGGKPTKDFLGKVRYVVEVGNLK